MSDSSADVILRGGDHTRRRWKFFEGWLEHKSKQSRHYTPYWCVLVEKTIHIFTSSQEKSEKTIVGSLTVDDTTQFKINSADDRNGYKFELSTSGGKRYNKFKSRKKVEMEMWRGYVLGLSKKDALDDLGLDLLYDQIQCIKDDIEQYYLMSEGNLYDNKRPVSEAPSGDSGIDARSSRTKNSEGTSSTISGPGGGPIMRHKFTTNPKLDDTIPSWFFENCNRDRAEKILVNANELGNTLMRESSSQKAQGSYVISKLSKLRGKPPTVEHFEVERVDRGYRIKVENKHDPMSTLMEVMTFFMFTAGVETTILMKSNCLADFGLADDGDVDPYDMKKIERVIPDSSMELPEPVPDYEEPVPSKPRTFTPGILKKETEKFYIRTDTDSNRKTQSNSTARYASTVREKNRTSQPSHNRGSPGPLRQPPPTPKQPALRSPPPPPPEPDQEFDDPAPGRESVYYNERDEVWHLKRSTSQQESPSLPTSVSLPPPTPHLTSSQGYINDRQSADEVPSMAAPSPPEEPPALPPKLPPRKQPEEIFTSVIKKKVQINDDISQFGIPRDQRAKSVPNIGVSSGQVKVGQSIDLNKTGNKPKRFSYLDPNQEPPASVKPSNLEQAIQQVRLRPSSNVGMPTQAKEEKKSVVKSPKASVTSPVSKTAPQVDKVPTPQEMGLRPTPKREPERVQQSPDVTQSEVGVDDSHPGSVKRLLGRFEQDSTLKQNQPTTSATDRKSGFIHSASTSKLTTNLACGATNKNRHSFGGFTYLNNQSSRMIATNNTNNSISSSNGVRGNDSTSSFSRATLTDDVMYVNPDAIEPINTSDEDEDGDDLYHDAFSPNPASATPIQSSFRRKLEHQLSNQQLKLNQGKSSNSRPVVQSSEDSEVFYEELPELPPEEDT